MNVLARLARLAGVLIVLALLAFVLWRFGPWGRAVAPVAPVAADSAQAGMRAVTLYFANADGSGLVAESREMLEQDGLHARVAAIVQALDQGPEHGGLPVLPPGTSVLHVYLDDRGTLTLDLSRAFQQGFRGGSSAEELAIGSLVRTLAVNVPELKRLRLICGGAPIASLAGHLPLDQPLEPHDWY